MDILKILLGIAATVIAAYITSCLLLAQKQLVAATRLAAYLTHWQLWILEHELSGMYAHGSLWNKQIRELIQRGGSAAELAKLKDEKKKQFGEAKQELEKIVYDKEELIRRCQRLPKEVIPNFLESSKLAKQNLIEGKTFISDEEATTLGMVITQACITLKMGLIELVDSGVGLLLVLVASPADFEIKDHSDEIVEVLWKGVLVSKDIDVLADIARGISKRSVFSLARQNIVSGRGLTKR